MAERKKTKPLAKPRLPEVALKELVALADEGRAEIHGQAKRAIGLVEAGVRLAHGLVDRVDLVAKETLRSVDGAFAAALARTRQGSERIAVSTASSARNVSNRATGALRVLAGQRTAA